MYILGISKASTCLLLRSILPLMSDTARDYQTVDTSSIQGMDQLFENETIVADKDSSESLKEVLPVEQGIPVEIAAARLGLSASGVLKRLRRGAMQGFKVPTKRGEKWLVSPSAIPSQVLDVLEDSLSQVSGVLVDDRESSLGVLSSAEESFLEVSTASELMEDLKRRNFELEASLQAATWRNGYLESKLEERDKQILMLTDNQHKGGWWAKFSSWFFKAR